MSSPLRETDRITVIIVTYNSRHILPLALPHLKTHPHVIVVDNGSADGSADLANELLPQAQVLRADANLGFGRANNLGLERVATDYALLLNPDSILRPDTLARLMQGALRYPEAAMLAPKLYDAPGVLGECYRRAFHEDRGGPRIDPEGDLCSDFLTGAALLLNMAIMRQVGFFDPWFFLYFEDDDLCLRARRAGHPLVLVHDAEVEHRVRQSSAPSPRLSFRRTYSLTLSKFYIQRKYLGTRACMRSILRVGFGSLLTLPIHCLMGNRHRVAHHAARLWAACKAPWRLRATHCMAD
jgi:N-acetylglucosaminyl-diphospho-decaprenol L-rhamnosyltransferase